MEIPKDRREVKRVSPTMMLIYSSPKSGKTTICAQLKNSLILECEPGGADFIEGRVVDISKPSEFNSALDSIEKSDGLVADYLIVDTTTALDHWSEIVGTYSYMNKPQGKKLNRENTVKAEMIMHTDPRFETVHDLPNGYGYKHSREVMLNWYNRLLNLTTLGKVNHVILLSHVKDKVVEAKNGDSVETTDIDLTGKVKSIYASKVDAIGYFSRKGTQGILNFDNENKVVVGGRCPHLNGEIVVSDKVDGKIVTYWDRIYI